MLGISTRFLVVWDDGSEYLKTMYFILLVRWQKPGIVYPEHLVLSSGKYPRVGKLDLPDAEHYLASISVKGKKASKCFKVPEMYRSGIHISNCRIHVAL